MANHSSTTMRACLLRDARRVEVADVPRPVPGPAEVLVRVAAVGLCGTDFHIFGGGANYNTDARGRPVPLTQQPQILGHEISGVVAGRGDDVCDLHEGTRVVLDQGLNCQSRRRPVLCEYCSTGDSHQCETYAEHGITGLPGGLAEFIVVPAVNAIPIEAELDSTEAAFTEPLGCIVHCIDLLSRASGGRFQLLSTEDRRRVRAVLIFGAGPAGLLLTQYLRGQLGFDGELLVSDPNPHKRELAAGFGANTFDPLAGDLAAWVAELTQGRRAELVIDASGAGRIFDAIPGVLRKQGSLVLYGHGHEGVGLDALNRVQFLEPTLIAPTGASGGFEPDGRPSTYVRALRLLEQGQVKVAPLLTHRYASLDDVPQALGADGGLPDYVKGVVQIFQDRQTRG